MKIKLHVKTKDEKNERSHKNKKIYMYNRSDSISFREVSKSMTRHIAKELFPREKYAPRLHNVLLHT